MKVLRFLLFIMGVAIGILGVLAIAVVSGNGSWGAAHGWPLVAIGASGMALGTGLIWLSRRIARP